MTCARSSNRRPNSGSCWRSKTEPPLSQRELARELGVSVGKANYLLKAMLGRGWIEARSFKNRHNKLAFRYALTAQGGREKYRLARDFLERKRAEFDALKSEIDQLSRQVGG